MINLEYSFSPTILQAKLFWYEKTYEPSGLHCQSSSSQKMNPKKHLKIEKKN